MVNTISPRRAAELLGVSESTMRRWCDRDMLRFSKTSGGHRRIGVADLLDFARRNNLEIVGEIAAPLESGEPPAALANHLYDHFVAGDAPAVRRLLASIPVRAMPPTILCDEVIAPALHRVGVAWESGELDVFQEHAATCSVEGALATLRDQFVSAGGAGARAICAGLAGDPYTIGPQMAALVLQGENYQVSLLGANTPPAQVIAAARANSANIIALSIGYIGDLETFLADFDRLSTAARESGIRVAVGGGQLSREIRKQMAADFFGDSMAHLAGFIRSLKRFSNDAA